MKKRIISILLVLIIAVASTTVSYASYAGETAADTLHKLGLFQGTGTDKNGNPIYSLDSKLTREQAITMLVRFLGKETEAKNGIWDIPFKDVSDWAIPYVGYAYNYNLTKGTSATTFSGNADITATQYITLFLRALGYKDGDDFLWSDAGALSCELGITGDRWKENPNEILSRDSATIISLGTLKANVKGKAFTLLNKLYDDGAVSAADVANAGLAEYITSPFSVTIPGAVTGVGVVTGANSAKLNWVAVDGATLYQILIWDDLSQNYVEWGTCFPSDKQMTFTLTDLSDGEYYVRVRGGAWNDGVIIYGDYGQVSFTLGSAATNDDIEACNNAIVALKSILKFPASLNVNTCRIYYANGAIVVELDYSAMNGFGGYNREYYVYNNTTGKGSVREKSSIVENHFGYKNIDIKLLDLS